jgi:hypothetical protein
MDDCVHTAVNIPSLTQHNQRGKLAAFSSKAISKCTEMLNEARYQCFVPFRAQVSTYFRVRQAHVLQRSNCSTIRSATKYDVIETNTKLHQRFIEYISTPTAATSK